MRVLITGVNGMLATNIVDNLLAKGYQVRGVLRDISKYRGERNSNLELIEGDFTSYSTAISVVEGCDYIIHSAAVTSQGLLRYSQYKSVNVDATSQLLKIALKNGIKRFVYVSTANTIGYGTPANPGDEGLPIMPPYDSSMYVTSKSEAESEVLAMGEKMDVVVANPTFMVGKYGDATGSNRIFKMARWLTLCPKGGRNFIAVDEAAEGVVATMLRGRRGERYLICGENLSYRDFFGMMPNVRYMLYTPNWLLRSIGVVGDLLRVCGVATDMSLTNMQMLCNNVGYSGEKAREELHFAPKLITENLEELLTYADEK